MCVGVLARDIGVLARATPWPPPKPVAGCRNRSPCEGVSAMSTATLDRGLAFVRSATMSLESDTQYQLMMEEKKKLDLPRGGGYKSSTKVLLSMVLTTIRVSQFNRSIIQALKAERRASSQIPSVRPSPEPVQEAAPET